MSFERVPSNNKSEIGLRSSRKKEREIDVSEWRDLERFIALVWLLSVFSLVVLTAVLIANRRGLSRSFFQLRIGM